MLKLVFDTNTFISAFFWEGNESRLFEQIEKNKAKLFVTQEILREVEDVLHRSKFSKVLSGTDQTPEQIIQKIISVSHLVIGPKLNIHVCRDKKDDKFLECAVLAKANYIVSGDKDLLVIKQYKDVKIVQSSDMLRLLK